MIDLKRNETVVPQCPHCSAEVKEVWFSELKERLGKRHIYFCAKCRKVLGVSNRKGFWMG